MTRKANVETVPGSFQKTQVREPVLCCKPGIFASGQGKPGTGSSDRYRHSEQGSLPTDVSYVFGYGSLIWRPSFAFVSRQRAVLSGFRRSFRQASSDHRGTPEQPGRVVTLVSSLEHHAVGVVYELAQPAARVLAELDHRERAGYERVTLQVSLDGGATASAATWIAAPGNAHDAGELDLDALSELITLAQGPSGRNDDYVYRLEQALLELHGADELVSELSRRLRAYGGAAVAPLLASGPPDKTT
jgi:cation transport regulator ChaC